MLVVAEQKDGVLNRASWEAVSAAQQIGGPVKIVVPGASVGATAKELAAADVAEVIALEHAPPELTAHLLPLSLDVPPFAITSDSVARLVASTERNG